MLLLTSNNISHHQVIKVTSYFHGAFIPTLLGLLSLHEGLNYCFCHIFIGYCDIRLIYVIGLMILIVFGFFYNCTPLAIYFV